MSNFWVMLSKVRQIKTNIVKYIKVHETHHSSYYLGSPINRTTWLFTSSTFYFLFFFLL